MTHEFAETGPTKPTNSRPSTGWPTEEAHEEEAHEETPDRPTVVSVKSEEGLIASVPAVLGFTPRESVVVLAQHGSAGRGRLGVALRADLPTSRYVREQLLAVIPSRIVATAADAVHLVLITEDGAVGRNLAPEDLGEEELPGAGLVAALRDGFAAVGIEVCSAFWLPTISRGAPWRCYGPCRCAGTLPDPGATEIAAHQTLLGKVTFRSREEAEAALAPTPASVSARARQLLDAAREHGDAARTLDRDQAARADLANVRAAAAAVGAGRGLDEESLATVAAALRDPAVRDVCLGFVLGADPEVRAEDAEQLWWALTRTTPAPEVAEPATLLAFSALLRGGGPQVRIGLDRAQAADPGHRLSGLVDAMIQRGVRPAAMREIAAGAAAEAAGRFEG